MYVSIVLRTNKLNIILYYHFGDAFQWLCLGGELYLSTSELKLYYSVVKNKMIF